MYYKLKLKNMYYTQYFNTLKKSIIPFRNIVYIKKLINVSYISIPT